MKYKINENIPGWSSAHKLNMLAKLSSEVPDYGWIVEIGSYVGRSSYALGMNKKDNVKLTCIDPWPCERFEQKKIREGTLGIHNDDDFYSIEAWEKNMDEVTNKEAIRMWMPLPLGGSLQFNNKADLLFIDGGHTFAETYQNLKDWVPYLTTPNATIVVDDYLDPEWESVTRAVDVFLESYPGEVEVYRNEDEHYCILTKKCLNTSLTS